MATATTPIPAISHWRLFFSRIAADLENSNQYESYLDDLLKFAGAIAPLTASPIVGEVFVGATVAKAFIQATHPATTTTVTPIAGPSVTMTQTETVDTNPPAEGIVAQGVV